MKEIGAQLLRFLREIGIGLWQREFARGVICGLAAYFVLVVLLRIVSLFRRRRHCSELIIAGKKGKITVTLKAVTSAVRAGLRGFRRLEITDVAIRRVGRGYAFVVNGRFVLGETAAPELRVAVAEKIRGDMKRFFGVDDIRDIDLRIDDCDGGSEKVEA